MFIACDHIAFVGKFRDTFIKSHNYPENIETFKAGLKEALASNSKLALKLLSGCTISIPGENSVYQSQDSMMVNFLMIDFLREHVLEVLLNRIDELACKEQNLSFNASQIPLLPLMLAQLRYVSNSQSELVYERIKNIFEKSTEAAKWDIIANAEFILDASKHDAFAQQLL